MGKHTVSKYKKWLYSPKPSLLLKGEPFAHWSLNMPAIPERVKALPVSA